MKKKILAVLLTLCLLTSAIIPAALAVDDSEAADNCPYCEETTAEDGTVTWIPVAAEVVDGKVKVVLTQEVMQLVLENDAVFALLSDHEVVVVDEAVEATGK